MTQRLLVFGGGGTFVSLPAASVMDALPDLLPTGRLADVAGTGLDLRRPVAVGTLDCDHEFTGIDAGRHARVEYRARGFADVAGLKTVPPGAVRRGSVSYAVGAC